MPDIPGNVMPVKTMVTVFGKASAAIGVNGVVVTAIRKILHMSVPILFPGTAVSWASHHIASIDSCDTMTVADTAFQIEMLTKQQLKLKKELIDEVHVTK